MSEDADEEDRAWERRQLKNGFWCSLKRERQSRVFKYYTEENYQKRQAGVILSKKAITND